MTTTLPVSSTDRIFYDEDFATFRLYAGNSLYAFCISPEQELEHLYWGVTLHPGYDLRYLSQSSRMSCFSTLEDANHETQTPVDAATKTLLEAKDISDLSRNISDITFTKFGKQDNMAQYEKRRLENYAWRKKGFQSSASRDELKDLGRQDDQEEQPTFTQRNRSGTEPNLVGTVLQGDNGSDRAKLRSLSYNLLKNLGDTPGGGDFDHSDGTRHKYDRSRSYSTPPLPIFPLPEANPKPKQPAFTRMAGQMGKGAICLEYSDHGTGDFRTPSFQMTATSNSSSVCPLKYKRHSIYMGKLPMPDNMPSIRSRGYKDASTLVVTLADVSAGMEVDLVYVVMHDYDAVTRRAVFRNTDCSTAASTSKVINKASSLTLDFESDSSPFFLTQLSGSWGRERYINENPLSHGMRSFGSARGVSSHQHNPFAVITTGPPHETQGEVKAFSLIYSGNFLVEAEVSEMGRLRINMGMHPMSTNWHLQSKAVFNTPECVMIRSDEGLGGMSRMLHRLLLDKLVPSSWADQRPPVLLNSWEAKYFNLSHDSIVEMAEQASECGIDLIVLDDGWFGKRNDDSTSLGDWHPNLDKFPYGMKGLAEDINKAGCKFGLWFEPEMISEDSDLFRLHPDWYLHVPGRPRQLGRNQMVLDLSRKEIVDHIFNVLSETLNSGNIEYVKWDMNRPLTEVFSVVASATMDSNENAVWQAEISHRYVLGLYDLQGRIVKAFPHILLENCASGGGRFDPGMLYFSPQIWCSDNTDALVRMKIQYGTSLAYPARCIGAHVSVVPNHMTGNSTRARTRGFVAMCGTFGFELDIGIATEAEKALFREQSNLFRQIAPIVRKGDLYRLWSPFRVSFAAWMYVSRNKQSAVVFAFCLNSDHWSNLVPRLMLQGLLPDVEYEVTEPLPNNMTQRMDNFMVVEQEAPVYQLGIKSVPFTGQILMKAGLPLKFYTLDDSVMFHLQATSAPKRHDMGSRGSSSAGLSHMYSSLTAPRAYKDKNPRSSTNTGLRRSTSNDMIVEEVVVGIEESLAF